MNDRPRITRSHASDSPGFSLLELLIVIAVIAILVALAVPAFNSIGESNRLTSATQVLIAELNRARQEAIAKNRAVEVRFYDVPPKDEPANTSLKARRALRTIVLDESAGFGTNARFGRLVHLPGFTQISSQATLTTPVLATNGTEVLPTFGAAEFSGFRFRPTGRADLATNAVVFWTLVGDRAAGTPPPNFSTIQLDARTGRVRLFRP